MEIPIDLWMADLTPVLETALDAVVVMRPDGVVAGWNSVAEEIFGWRRTEAIGRQLSDLIIPIRYREAHHRGLEAYLETGEGPVLNRHVEISALRSSGEEFSVELSITPTSVSGELVFLGFLRDISTRKAAETALKESEARLATTYNHAMVGIAEVDRDGRFLRANDQYSVLTGYSLQELQTKTFFDITHPADAARDRELFEEQWSGTGQSYTIEKRYVRKDGGVIWVEVAASIVQTEDCSEAYGVRILRDVTDKKSAEVQQRLLLHELNHRVKNTLTVVQGLAYQTFKGSAVPVDLVRSFEGRLAALAAAHNLVMKQTWEATPISSAAEAAVGPFQTADRRITLAGPAVLLTPAATVTLTLALHELATNAAKYGALSTDHGKIEINWEVNGGALTMVWRERDGPVVAEPETSGFGTRLLKQAVARDWGGTVSIDFCPPGLVCTISAPLERITP
ncbi:MAG TPA: PAS domain S-box protein [Sphingomicrobium sp.]|nr:PAS domain S-box protein [Sphingomicrobium sp.]